MRSGRLGRFAAVSLIFTTVLLAHAGPASAAELEKVPDFGPNPGGLAMFVYTPAEVAASAPAVVLMHGCGGAAAGLDTSTGWRTFANRHHFLLVLPQTPDRRCFSWGDGREQGDAASIASMVAYATTKRGTDPRRVYATGFSAGGGMTNTMLATYPDLFAGGAPVAGIPYRCTTLEDCTADNILRAYPGYTGPRPRVQIWHGTADKVVPIIAADGTRNQWTAVLGTATTPSSTEQLRGQTTKFSYANGTGQVLVTDYRLEGLAHQIPVEPGTGPDNCGGGGSTAVRICYAYHAVSFLGLDVAR